MVSLSPFELVHSNRETFGMGMEICRKHTKSLLSRFVNMGNLQSFDVSGLTP